MAIEVLGANHRFETRFYVDGDRVLYIRGGGDPFLISEELAQLASELVTAIGKEPLSGIVQAPAARSVCGTALLDDLIGVREHYNSLRPADLPPRPQRYPAP